MIPCILFITCMPLEKPRTASMAFMSVLLEKYADSFTWFSIRPPDPDTENPFNIPYAYAQRLTRPSRFPWLRQYINLGPWASYQGHKAAKFGRSQNVEVVLADLAFEAVVAGRVAAQLLNIPLLVSVHDDPVNRIDGKGYPAWLMRSFETNFSKTMRAAERCAVISDYMGEEYRERYGVKTITLFIGVDEGKCLPSKSLDIDKQPIYIGSIGSMNSVDNWNMLIDSIRILNHRYGKEKFRILHIGNLSNTLQTTDEVEVTGWVPEKKYLYHLSRIDIGFLNWSFNPIYAETSRTSLPMKTHSYIQAQRPMLALGPSDSSIVRLIKDYQCGISCSEDRAEDLAKRIEELLFSKSAYAESLKGVQKLKQIFSREKFFENFEAFISV